MDLKELPGKEPESQLAKIVLKKHPEKIVTILIHGNKGVGKSMFATKVMWEIFEALGYKENEAYEKAFNNIIFRPDKFLKKVKEIEEKLLEGDNPFEGVEPCLCWDDAGVGLGGGLYRQFRDTYERMQVNWQTVRTHVSGLFMTTPLPQLISKSFRGWDFRVQVREYREMGPKYGAIAYIYPEKTDVIGEHSYVDGDKAWNNKFSAHMPNKYYYPYHRKRIKFTREYEEFVKESKKKEKGIKEKAEEEGIAPEKVEDV